MLAHNKTKDLIHGFVSEANHIGHLSGHFGCELTKTTSKYDLFDFESSKCRVKIELKTRRNTKNRYPTTMVGYNKILAGQDLILYEGYRVYFCFKFTDGLYYYELTDNSHNEYIVNQGGRRDRGRDEIKKYCFIPVELLKKIDLHEGPQFQAPQEELKLLDELHRSFAYDQIQDEIALWGSRDHPRALC